MLEPIFSISSDNQPSSWRPSPNDTLEHDQSMLMVGTYVTAKKFLAPLTSTQLDRCAVDSNSLAAIAHCLRLKTHSRSDRSLLRCRAVTTSAKQRTGANYARFLIYWSFAQIRSS